MIKLHTVYLVNIEYNYYPAVIHFPPRANFAKLAGKNWPSITELAGRKARYQSPDLIIFAILSSAWDELEFVSLVPFGFSSGFNSSPFSTSSFRNNLKVKQKSTKNVCFYLHFFKLYVLVENDPLVSGRTEVSSMYSHHHYSQDFNVCTQSKVKVE